MPDLRYFATKAEIQVSTGKQVACQKVGLGIAWQAVTRVDGVVDAIVVPRSWRAPCRPCGSHARIVP